MHFADAKVGAWGLKAERMQTRFWFAKKAILAFFGPFLSQFLMILGKNHEKLITTHCPWSLCTGLLWCFWEPSLALKGPPG